MKSATMKNVLTCLGESALLLLMAVLFVITWIAFD